MSVESATRRDAADDARFVVSCEESGRLGELLVSSLLRSDKEIMHRFERSAQSMNLHELIHELESRDVSDKFAKSGLSWQDPSLSLYPSGPESAPHENILDFLDEKKEEEWINKMEQKEQRLKSGKHQMIESITEVGRLTAESPQSQAQRAPGAPVQPRLVEQHDQQGPMAEDQRVGFERNGPKRPQQTAQDTRGDRGQVQGVSERHSGHVRVARVLQPNSGRVLHHFRAI